jgi:transcriptional regulator with XRE-family HTH domain
VILKMQVAPSIEFEAAQFLKRLGKMIQEERKQRGMRLVDVFALSGVAPSSLRLIERGEYKGFASIYKVLRALGFTLEVSK